MRSDRYLEAISYLLQFKYNCVCVVSQCLQTATRTPLSIRGLIYATLQIRIIILDSLLLPYVIYHSQRKQCLLVKEFISFSAPFSDFLVYLSSVAIVR
jgi:hypothetical protein